MISPVDLGFPRKFKNWRPGQFEAIEGIKATDAFVYLLDAPTGVGKSAIGIGAYSRMIAVKRVLRALEGDETRYRCVYVTRTKQLQDQVLNDFPHARTIKGRRNYPCGLYPDQFPEVTADDCVKDFKDCKAPCAYRTAKSEALRAPVAVLNEPYYLAEVNGPGQFAGADFVILDEIDSIESSLMSFIELTITEQQLTRLEIKPPDVLDNKGRWLAWADFARAEALQRAGRLEEALEKLEEPSSGTFEWGTTAMNVLRDLKRLRSFESKMRTFIADVNDTWIFSLTQGRAGVKGGWKVTFKPVLVADYAWGYLWRHGGQFVGMSGTIFDPAILAEELGIDGLAPVIPVENGQVFAYQRMDSPFPLENRPIFYAPAVSLKYATMETELPNLAKYIDQIVNQYPGDNVLIHTVSNRVRDYLIAKLPHRVRRTHKLMTHDTDNREERLREFKSSLDPAVMISPSFDRGVDLPDKTCRCNIICKVPYLDLSDKQVKARMQRVGGQRWYSLRAAQTLVQMTGRVVRGEQDYGDTWILDRQFSNLLARTRHVIPQWWQDAITTVEVRDGNIIWHAPTCAGRR